MEDMILLVEDDPDLGGTLKVFFEDNGLSVRWATDGDNAVRLFKESHPRLTLLDVILPRKDGFEVATEIRKLNRTVPIIFMTGTALEKESYNRAYRLLKAINYIEKPVNPYNALAQIQSLLHPPDVVKKYNIKDYDIVIGGQLLTIDNVEIQLRDKEALVLSLLLENVNSTVNRKDILLKVWNNDASRMNNTLDRTVSGIKKALTGFLGIVLKTIYAEGYRLTINERK